MKNHFLRISRLPMIGCLAIAICLLGLSQISCDSTSSEEVLNKSLALRIIQALDQKTPAVFDDIIAGDYIQDQNGFTADSTGPYILKATINWDDATFKSVKYTIADIISKGDKVAVRLVLQGTSHENHKVTHHIITIMRFKEGKLVEGWITNDFYSLGNQLSPPSGTDQ